MCNLALIAGLSDLASISFAICLVLIAAAIVANNFFFTTSLSLGLVIAVGITTGVGTAALAGMYADVMNCCQSADAKQLLAELIGAGAILTAAIVVAYFTAAIPYVGDIAESVVLVALAAIVGGMPGLTSALDPVIECTGYSGVAGLFILLGTLIFVVAEAGVSYVLWNQRAHP
jgi:hypothetical protein